MPSKQAQPEFDTTEVVTLLRMANGNTVRELIELSHYLRDTPVSGDTIALFSSPSDKSVVEALAKTSKVRQNEGMDNNTSLRISTTTVYAPSMEIRVPLSITVHYEDTSYDQVFTFDPETGEYLDKDRNALYIEPVNDDGLITTNSYFEVPESM